MGGYHSFWGSKSNGWLSEGAESSPSGWKVSSLRGSYVPLLGWSLPPSFWVPCSPSFCLLTAAPLVDATGAPASASPPPWAEGQRSKPHEGTTVYATQGLFEVNDTAEAETPLRPLLVVFNRA